MPLAVIFAKTLSRVYCAVRLPEALRALRHERRALRILCDLRLRHGLLPLPAQQGSNQTKTNKQRQTIKDKRSKTTEQRQLVKDNRVKTKYQRRASKDKQKKTNKQRQTIQDRRTKTNEERQQHRPHTIFEKTKNSRSLVPAVCDYVDERATSSGKAKNS